MTRFERAEPAPILPRRLWRETRAGLVEYDQKDLIDLKTPLIVLGEPGMGKTELLRWIGSHPDHAFCTARQLNNVRPSPVRLLGDATTLVIDALDELSVQGEGDAVDAVLQKLGDAGYPNFVLSCRAADWRNATGVTAIEEQYPDAEILVLHLHPLTDDEVQTLLAVELAGDEDRAQAVIAHFTNAQLQGLLGNPQTLELIARVAAAGPLPQTKAALFERAVELLRREARSAKAAQALDEATALDAAGAAFASLILTGAEALVVGDVAVDGEIPIAEIAALPSAGRVQAALQSRLFGTAGAADRFTYWHRRIGEYLGSRWLARQTDAAMKRKRLLALFRAHGVVPSSLRGLHAWLAHHSADLASSVIAFDPLGVIDYGDPDALNPAQARDLLEALRHMAETNPNFREWRRYPVRGLAQPALLEDFRHLLTAPDIDFGLQLLAIEAVDGSSIADALRTDLRRLMLQPTATYAHRRRAADALITLGDEPWPVHLQALGVGDTEDGIRLALEIIREVGVDAFEDAVIAAFIVAQARVENRVVGLFAPFQDAIADVRLDGVLNALVPQIATLGHRHERPGNNELTDLGYTLIARRLALGPVDALRLWAWLRPFDAERGYSRESRVRVHELIRAHTELRRAIQRHVLLDEPGPKGVYARAAGLVGRSTGFAFTDEDVVVLLGLLDPSDRRDETWQDLVQLVRHSASEGGTVRSAAKARVANRPDMVAWIDRLAEPRVPEWEVKRAARERKEALQREAKYREHRAAYAKRADGMRGGKFEDVIDPAKAYLSLFNDMDESAHPRDRLIGWLGEELADIACEGFEAYLQSDQPPTAEQMARSHAERTGWNGPLIIVAALAERLRIQAGWTGVSDDRLTAGFYELKRTMIEDHAKLDGLGTAIEAEMRVRGLETAALEAWIEPQLAQGRIPVDQLHQLMREPNDPMRSADLAEAWLARFPALATEAEVELIDRLIASRRYGALRTLADARLATRLSEARRRDWDTVSFLTDFEAQRERLARVASDDRQWLWSIRRRLAGSHERTGTPALTVAQAAFLLSAFRGNFPVAGFPQGSSWGDQNPWDASEYLKSVARRLADLTSDDAVASLCALRDAPPDSYTGYLQGLAAEQQTKRGEAAYRPAALADLRAIVEAQSPKTAADLQATMLELLEQVQKRVYADPADPWRGYRNDAGAPFHEERCRDHLLTMLGVRPEGIDLMPEGHLADDNRADIIAAIAGLRCPVEIKGQWHPELWRAADSQLDRLYATDYAADRRGVYLVLWFGENVPQASRPRGLGRGRRRLSDPEALRRRLIEASPAARDGRVEIVVLDLERPPRA